jgi:hypothetical protein
MTMATIKEMMGLMKIAGSGEMQNMIETFAAEIDAIKLDRQGLKAAMPLALDEFRARLDALQKRMDDGFAGLNARLDLVLQSCEERVYTRPIVDQPQKEPSHVNDHQPDTASGTYSGTGNGIALHSGSPANP